MAPRSQPVTRGLAGLTAANAGEQWNAAASGTLGAWSFGFGQSPRPASITTTTVPADDQHDIDHCTRFTAVNIPCGTLLPGQRTDTTPQVGTTSSDIQLTAGDTADSITGNITLPTTLTVGGNTLNLMWSVHHDPRGDHTPTRSPSAAGSSSSMPVTAPPAAG